MMQNKQWLVDASCNSGMLLDELTHTKYVYPFDAFYSFLNGQLPVNNQCSSLPFGFPSACFLRFCSNSKFKNDSYYFRSTLDGSRQSLPLAELVKWLNSFKQVVLPYELRNLVLSPKVKVFLDFSEKDNLEQAATMLNVQGMALNLEHVDEVSTLVKFMSERHELSFYLYGDTLEKKGLSLLFKLPNVSIQTNYPLLLAKKGIFIVSDSSSDDIYSKNYELDNKPLLDECDCTTCKNHSRSYLHHLYQHTPILAIQLLAVHNVHHWLSKF